MPARASFSVLDSVLVAYDTTSANQIVAVNSLSATDPSEGAGFSLPVGYADLLTGSAATNRTGNDLDKVLIGNSAANVLIEGAGPYGT